MLGVIFWTSVLALVIYVMSYASVERDVAKFSEDKNKFILYQTMIVLLMFALALVYLQIIISVLYVIM